jgi:hypothetical protein
VTNNAVYTSNFTVPTTLPTAVAGTQLLLNFGATAAPVDTPSNPSAGTVLSTETNTVFIVEENQTVYNGTFDVIADGFGGSGSGNYQYPSSGTGLYDNGSTYHYVADGSGGYTQEAYSGYDNDYFSGFQSWLSSNNGVNQYIDYYSFWNARWFVNQNTAAFLSQADAQAAADAGLT